MENMADKSNPMNQPPIYKKPQIWKAAIAVGIFLGILLLLFWFVWPFFKYVRTGQKTTSQNPVTTTVREVISQPRETLLGANLSLNTVVTQAVKGDKGDDGQPGEQGVQGIEGTAGPAGVDGIIGKDGAAGVDGEKGEDGATGPAGSSGSNGSNGAQGAAGAQGPQGDPGVPDGNAIVQGGNTFGADITLGANDNHSLAFLTNGAQQMTIDTSGNIIVTNGRFTANNGITTGANTTARSSIRLASSGGVNVSAPVSGDIWWNGTNLYFYDGSSTVDLLAGSGGPCPTCFVNGGNAFGSLATLGTTDNNNLEFITNNVTHLQLTPDGRLFSTASAGVNQYAHTFNTTTTGTALGGIQSNFNILHNSPLTRLVSGINSTLNYNINAANAGAVSGNNSRVNILQGSVTGAFGYTAHVDNFGSITSAQGMTGNDIELENHVGATAYEFKGIQQILNNRGTVTNPIFTSMESEINNYDTASRMTAVQLFPTNYGTINGYMINSYNNLKNFGTVTADVYGQQIVTQGNGTINGSLVLLELNDTGEDMLIDGSEYGIRMDLSTGNVVDSAYGVYLKNMLAVGAVNNYGLYIEGASGGSGENYAIYSASGYNSLIGKTFLGAATTSDATANIASGANPSSPNSGDLWYNGTNLNFRNGGTTVDLLADSNGCVSNCFLQGGNTFGADAVLGTNDTNSLLFRTDGTTRLTLNTTGDATLAGGNLIVNGRGSFGDATAANYTSTLINVNATNSYAKTGGDLNLLNGLGSYTPSGNNGTETVRGFRTSMTINAGDGSDLLAGRAITGLITNNSTGTVADLAAILGIATNNGIVSARQGVMDLENLNHGTYSGVDSRTARFYFQNFSGAVIPEFYGLSSNVRNDAGGTANGRFMGNASEAFNAGTTANSMYSYYGNSTNNGIVNGDVVSNNLRVLNNGTANDLVGDDIIIGNSPSGVAVNSYGVRLSISGDASSPVSGNGYGAYFATISASATHNYGLYLEGVSTTDVDSAASWVQSGLSRFAPATTNTSSIRIANSNGVNNAAPFDGDLWYNGTNLNFRNGATTVDLLAGGGGGCGGTCFEQGGNAFGATGILGTADDNSLTFITNNTTKATILNNGKTSFITDLFTDGGYGLDVTANLDGNTGNTAGGGGISAVLNVTDSTAYNARLYNGIMTHSGSASTGGLRGTSISMTNNSGAEADSMYGGFINNFNQGTIDSGVSGFVSQVSNTGTAVRMDGVASSPINGSGGLITDVQNGLFTFTTNNGDNTGNGVSGAYLITSGTGTTTDLYGLRLQDFGTQTISGDHAGISIENDFLGGENTITGNDYGIHLDGIDTSGSANNYGIYLGNVTGANGDNLAIYSAGGDSYLSGALHLGDTGQTADGYIRYTGADFEGYTGGSWISLTGGAAGAPFQQNGNAFGSTAYLGTTDNNDLYFITNNNFGAALTAGGNFGLGTSTPDAKMEIAGDYGGNYEIGLDIRGQNANGSFLNITQTGIGAWGIGQSAGSGNLNFYNNRYNGNVGTLSMQISNNDNVGIGNYLDAAFLSLGAATTGKASLNIANSTGDDVSAPNDGDLWWNGTNLYFNNGASNYDLLGAAAGVCPTCIVDGGNATGNPISIGTTDTQPLNFLTDNTTRMTILDSGFVGIGTTNPTDFLTVDIGSAFSGGMTIQGTPSTFGNFGLTINNQNSGGHSWFIDGTDDNAGHNGNLLIRDSNIGDDFFAFSQQNGALFGVGTNDPTAGVTISDSSATRAQIHLSGGGADVSAPDAGDLWWNGTNLYFNDGTTDIDLLAGGGGGDATAFHNNGDAFGTSTYIGTTDTQDLHFLTDNGVNMTLTTTGRLGLGTQTPNAYFQIENDFGNDNAGSIGFDVRGLNGTGSVFNVSQDGVGAWGLGMDAGSSTFGFYGNRDTGGTGSLKLALADTGNLALGGQQPTANLLDVQKSSTGDYIASFINQTDDVTNNGVLISTGESTPTVTNTLMTFQDGNGDEVGSITFDGVGTQFNTTSDVRLKKDIEETKLDLETLMKIQVRDYNWKNHPTAEKTHGFIAQDLFEIYPQAVSKPNSPDGTWSVDYSKLMPLVIKSIQDQQVLITQLQSQVQGTSTASAEMQAAIQSHSSSPAAQFADEGAIAQIVKWNYNTWTFMGDVTFNAQATFASTAEFIGNVVFKAPVEFVSTALFKDRVTFADKDMGGSLTIPAGQTTASVSFNKPFAKTPVVNLTAQGQVVTVAIDQVTSTGFTVKIAAPLSENLNVLWTALSIQYDGDLLPTPSASAAPQVYAPSATPTPVVAPIPDVSPSPAATPAASPESSPSPSSSASPQPSTSPEQNSIP